MWPVAGPSEYWLLASSPASKVTKKKYTHSTANTHRWQHPQQYTRPTNSNYTQDNVKLGTIRTRQINTHVLRICSALFGRPASCAASVSRDGRVVVAACVSTCFQCVEKLRMPLHVPCQFPHFISGEGHFRHVSYLAILCGIARVLQL